MQTLRRQVAVAALSALAAAGCATTDFRIPERAQDREPALAALGLSKADRAFLLDSMDLFAAGAPDDPSPQAEQPDSPADGRPRLSAGTVSAFASVGDWPFAWEAMERAGIPVDRLRGRVKRIFVTGTERRWAARLEVTGARFPAAMAMHLARWERVRFGRWRSPDKRVEVDISDRNEWLVRGRSEPESEWSVEVVSLLDHPAPAAGSGGARALIRLDDLRISGLPTQVRPERALVVVRTRAARGEELTVDAAADGDAHGDATAGSETAAHQALVDAALPYAGERRARLVTTTLRLLLPSVINRVGLSLDESFSIARDREHPDVVVVRGLLVDAGRAGEMVRRALAEVAEGVTM